MTTLAWLTFLQATLAIVFFAASQAPLLAQSSFEIDRFTVDGGGGTSPNGQYTLTGTIGQPEAGGPMTNGQYSLTGGFWVLPVAVQTPGAPPLSIFMTATNTVVVSWPYPSSGWVLKQNTDGVTSGNWSVVQEGIQDDNTNRFLLLTAPTGKKFFRLQKQ